MVYNDVILMLPRSLAFVDIETTGSSPFVDRAIEIGIVRVDDGVVREFSTLLDPGVPISPFITGLTGIDARAVEEAPSFYEMKDVIAEYLEGALFVAHNARFDFGFLKQEFKRFEMPFTPKQLCTVKLSRRIFPSFLKHDLSTIIERFGFECDARHRALGDAKVVWDFYRHLLETQPMEKLVEVVGELSRRPTLPPRLAKKYMDKLPEAPGVYVFYDKGTTPLYIGKSINVRDRVLSHFSSDYTSAHKLELVSLIESIDVHPTGGDLSAQLLESEMIKSYQPLFNRQLRYVRKITLLKKVVTPEGYFGCEIVERDHIDMSEIDDVLGVFRSKKQIREFLSECVKEYSLCQKFLGLEKTHSGCFAYQLGWCRGACIGKEAAVRYNMRFTEAFSMRRIKSWPFAGPVTICESHGDVSSTFLVDKWCVLGRVDSKVLNSESENIDVFSGLRGKDVYFDYDAYKILLRYMSSHHHLIRPYKFSGTAAEYLT